MWSYDTSLGDPGPVVASLASAGAITSPASIARSPYAELTYVNQGVTVKNGVKESVLFVRCRGMTKPEFWAALKVILGGCFSLGSFLGSLGSCRGHAGFSGWFRFRLK